MIYQRNITDRFLESVEEAPITLLTGARQVGKSTFCESMLAKQISGQYVTLDDITMLAAAHSNPVAFLNGLEQTAIIDEIQRAPSLFVPLKRLIDKTRGERRFILTGSANVLSLPKISESLAGRMEIHSLWPLSQGELRGTKETLIDHLLIGSLPKRPSRLSWDEMVDILLLGGYPESLKRRSAARRATWFSSYLSAIMQRDIRELANIDGLIEIPNLLSFIASRVGSLLNFSELSRVSGIPNTTLKRYYALLKNVFLIVALPAWHSNFEKRMVKSQKIYLNDTGLLCYLRGVDKDRLAEESVEGGPVLENFVVLELFKQLTWSAAAGQLYHFRTDRGQEVDVVIETSNRKLIGIEVKRAASASAADFKGLKVLKEVAGSKFQMGIVLYCGAETVPFDRDLYAMPITALWGSY